MKKLSFGILLLFNLQVKAQTNFWLSSKAYLGQKPPLDTPQVFDKGIILDSGIVLGRVAFSKDGKEFYYTFAKHWFDNNGTGIKRIVFDEQKWKMPEVVCKTWLTPPFQ